jgi:peptide/nickel transport system permease protein
MTTTSFTTRTHHLAGARASAEVRRNNAPRRRRTTLTPGGAVGIAILILLAGFALVGPWLVAADPAKQVLRARLIPPLLFGGDWAHPLGTDQLGRDLFARLAVGGRISLLIGIFATAIAGVVGVSLGVAAGYLGGWVDRLVTFLADVQLALPFVLVAIGVVAVLGNSTRNVIAILAVTGWVGYARVLRLEVAKLRRAPFIEAATAIGANRTRIMARHLAPNVAGPIIVIATQQIAALMLFEAALSYLGLGVSPGTLTWGSMMSAGREQVLTAWWVATIPGIAIAFTILGLNLTGDWLQTRLAPDHRRRG